MSEDTTIERFNDHNIEDRYVFDFDRCHFGKGWAQIDTRQNASWFGQWANPIDLQIVTYAEGDVTIETASNAEEFAAMIRKHEKWNIDNEHGFKIDGMCQTRIIDAFHALGLNDLLH